MQNPCNEEYFDDSSEINSTTRSIERISLDVNTIPNQNILTLLGNISHKQENLGSRLDRLTETHNLTQENLSRRLDRLAEHQNLTQHNVSRRSTDYNCC